METMHAAGRRNLPPVPRPASDPSLRSGAPSKDAPAGQEVELRRRLPDDAADQVLGSGPADDDTAVLPTVTDADDLSDTADDDTADDDTADDDTADEVADDADENDADEDDADEDGVEDAVLDPAVLAAADEPELALDDDDPAQDFVSRLRAAAADFAAAAGAQTAVVREAVPPARHRRSRCRVVFQYTDGAEADLTFLGAVGRPGTPAWQGFDEHIQRWLGTGQERRSDWLVEDAEAPDGVAVDVPAWLAAG